MRKNTCTCTHHKLVPILALLFAILFLLHNCGYINDQFLSIAWPMLVGLGAISFLGEDECPCC